MKKYPIGIQSFKSLREGGYIYIDKTQYIQHLTDSGKHYFLSRPRRFGKSLFLDTMHCAFEGKKELFSGLHLENNWNWDRKYPVLKISFGSGVHRNIEELRQTIDAILINWTNDFGITYKTEGFNNRLSEAIRYISKKCDEQVVVLIDEYDKPILDNIKNIPLAVELREELKNFYSVLKDADQYLKLVFITGVTKFSKVSLFSGLNNLKDITIDDKYSTLCGYSQDELEASFSEELKQYDKETIKEWYNGFSWGNGAVYNPFDILLFFDSGVFKNYWFESGTPRFLLKLIEKNNYFIPDLENIEVSEAIAESFEIEDLNLETMLFQTGYLTIKKITEMLPGVRTYTLSYPNKEVRMSLNDSILGYVSSRQSDKEQNRIKLFKVLKSNNFDGMQSLFHSFFASIPHDWFRKNNIAEYEGFYASVFYAYFCALGLEVKVEDATNLGRLDMVVIFEGRCYIFEFKVTEYSKNANSALQQIKDKKYPEKYANDYNEIYLIGVEFNKTDRNIVSLEWGKYME